MSDKITVTDIQRIEPGTSITWTLPPAKCLSAKAMAYEYAFKKKDPRIERYKVSINTKESKITITAIPVKPKQL